MVCCQGVTPGVELGLPGHGVATEARGFIRLVAKDVFIRGPDGELIQGLADLHIDVKICAQVGAR